MSLGPEFDTFLEAPLTAHEIRWGSELAEKLPHDEDLTFLEIKILARIPMEEWPAELLLKVKDYMNFEELDNEEESS